jgi:hypothetical protein
MRWQRCVGCLVGAVFLAAFPSSAQAAGFHSAGGGHPSGSSNRGGGGQVLVEVTVLGAAHFMGTGLTETGITETGLAGTGITVIGITTAIFGTIVSSLHLGSGFMAGATRTTGIIPTTIRMTTRTIIPTTIPTRTMATTLTMGLAGRQATATGPLPGVWIPRYNLRSQGGVIIGDRSTG